MNQGPSVKTTSFLLGAAVSLTAVFLVQRIQKWVSSPQRAICGGERSNDETTTNTSFDNEWDASNKSKGLIDSPDLDLRLLRKAEAVIRNRTSSITIVVERCTNDHNYSAILRTAEALGIQNVWIIDPPCMTDGAGNVQEIDDEQQLQNSQAKNTINRQRMTTARHLTRQEIKQRQQHRLFAQNATEWITIRDFPTSAECIAACRETGHRIWVTDLSQKAVPLVPTELKDCGNWPLPPKLAIVMGTEAVGCSQEMLESADLRVYLPLRGFADSLNLSVATALVIHHVFLLEPSYVGRMTKDERRELRTLWYPKLARQRLLGSADKKTRKKILNAIQECERTQAKKDAGHDLTPEQLEKLSKLPQHQESLKALEESANYNTAAVDRAVAHFVLSPPEPLSDLRRADLHRVSFVGKGTKSNHAEHWKDMAAVSGGRTEERVTASFFRERVAASVGEVFD